MSPRAYNLGKRKAATEETRGRIIEAARRLLSAPDGVGAFTIDAVAREAGVARMTVYYQYGSKAALLDALYDDLAARGLVPALQSVFRAPDPRAAFAALVDAFCRFWAGDRVITRRLRALARLDPVIDEGIRGRDEWRRGHFGRALQRIGAETLPEPAYRDLLDTVLVATSFESYDQLAEARGDAEASRLTLMSVQALLTQAGVRLSIGD
jgi:AcrR family transcriptional regulator